MNYIWSKKSLLDFLYNSIISVVKRKDFTFSDLFAGTGIVWRYFKEKWHQVIANDLQYYSVEQTIKECILQMKMLKNVML